MEYIFEAYEHKKFTRWYTGLPCSGKSVLAETITDFLKKRDMKVERLDGEIVRKSLTKVFSFTKEDRNKNIEKIRFIDKVTLLFKGHVVAVYAIIFISSHFGSKSLNLI